MGAAGSTDPDRGSITEDEGNFGEAKPLEELKSNRRSWRAGSRRSVLNRWQKRQLQSQLFAVVRHAERADSLYAFYKGGRWSQTDDFLRYPVDPPLSDAGLLAAAEDTAQVIRGFALEHQTQMHIIVTSPYMRCVQTAAEICREFGPKARILIDRSLGEVYGPSIMGETEPPVLVRTVDQIVQYCRTLGVRCMAKAIGEWPKWPEDLKAARRRYANRFLEYLRRSTMSRRNFVLVTHGDAVGAVLSLMPSQANTCLEKVEFGGLFLASRQLPSAPGGRGGSAADRTASCGATTGARNQNRQSGMFSQIMPKLSTPVDDEVAMESEPEMDDHIVWKSLATMDRKPSNTLWDGSGPMTGPNQVLFKGQVIREFCTPEPPKASDGWTVQTHDLITHERPKERISEKAGSAFAKKMSSLVKLGKYSKPQVEALLGALSDAPLGGVGAEGNPWDHGTNRGNSGIGLGPSVFTQASLSTYMFGASDFQSEICSEVSDADHRSMMTDIPTVWTDKSVDGANDNNSEMQNTRWATWDGHPKATRSTSPINTPPMRLSKGEPLSPNLLRVATSRKSATRTKRGGGLDRLGGHESPKLKPNDADTIFEDTLLHMGGRRTSSSLTSCSNPPGRSATMPFNKDLDTAMGRRGAAKRGSFDKHAAPTQGSQRGCGRTKSSDGGLEQAMRGAQGRKHSSPDQRVHNVSPVSKTSGWALEDAVLLGTDRVSMDRVRGRDDAKHKSLICSTVSPSASPRISPSPRSSAETSVSPRSSAEVQSEAHCPGTGSGGLSACLQAVRKLAEPLADNVPSAGSGDRQDSRRGSEASQAASKVSSFSAVGISGLMQRRLKQGLGAGSREASPAPAVLQLPGAAEVAPATAAAPAFSTVGGSSLMQRRQASASPGPGSRTDGTTQEPATAFLAAAVQPLLVPPTETAAAPAAVAAAPAFKPSIEGSSLMKRRQEAAARASSPPPEPAAAPAAAPRLPAPGPAAEPPAAPAPAGEAPFKAVEGSSLVARRLAAAQAAAHAEELSPARPPTLPPLVQRVPALAAPLALAGPLAAPVPPSAPAAAQGASALLPPGFKAVEVSSLMARRLAAQATKAESAPPAPPAPLPPSAPASPAAAPHTPMQPLAAAPLPPHEAQALESVSSSTSATSYAGAEPSSSKVSVTAPRGMRPETAFSRRLSRALTVTRTEADEAGILQDKPEAALPIELQA